MTEQALFYAYRNVDGTYSAECACGGIIEAQSDDAAQVAEAMNLHSESSVHAQWSVWQAAVHALQRPTRKPCPCHSHIAEVAS